MFVGLLDVDSKIPNLALMKLAAFHRALGDRVEWFMPLHAALYGKIYASKIFSTSGNMWLDPQRMEIGGSGWDLAKVLPPEVEALAPDYSLYNYPHNIGFTMRGCRLKCEFCVVPKKEGGPRPASTIAEIWTQRDSSFVVLLDNDFFGGPDWSARLAEIKNFGLSVNFNQGVNIRTISDEQAAALAGVKYRNLQDKEPQICFAWDQRRHERAITRGFERCRAAGIPARNMMFYVLIGFDSTPAEDLYRVETLRSWGADPFVMAFDRGEDYQRAFARWVNHKAIFNSVSWENYRDGVKRDRSSHIDQGPLELEGGK